MAALRVVVITHDPSSQAFASFAAEARTADVSTVSPFAWRQRISRGLPDVIMVHGAAPAAIDIVRQIREISRTVPILFVASAAESAVWAMRAGATDFVRERAAVREVLVRVQFVASALRSPRSLRTIGPLQLNRETRSLTCRASGRSVVLSPIEMQVLEQLLLQPGCPVSRATLERSIWHLSSGDRGRASDTNVAVVYISYLRRKLAQVGTGCSIRTIVGTGYLLVVKGAADVPAERDHG